MLACVADVTEIHHGTESLESVNEINYVDAEVNEPATNEAIPREILTLIPSKSSFMFHKDFYPQTKNHVVRHRTVK